MHRWVFVVLTSVIGLAGQATLLNTRQGIPRTNTPGGNVLFPGGGTVDLPRGPHGGNFARPGVGFGAGMRRGAGRNRTVVIPYGVPVYFNGDYSNGYGNQISPAEDIPQQQMQTPIVVINQNFVPESAHPSMRVYAEGELQDTPSRPGVQVYESPITGGGMAAPVKPSGPPPIQNRDPAADEATIYLIALKDGSVHSAVGYWVDNGALQYVTAQGAINRVTVDQVDKKLTQQLNTERKVDFELKNW